MKATRFVHIGYPKNMSTTLQRGFFDAHPEIHFLGIGVGSNVGYVSPEIGTAIELYLQYCKDFKWQEEAPRLTQAFARELAQADAAADIRAVGFSLEHLSFSYTPDNIDVTTKARRACELMGRDLRVVMVVREQWALFRSYWRECVRQGYRHGFDRFCEYAFKFQDRSFVYDFLYDRMFGLWSGLVGVDNVLVLPLEELRSGGTLVEEASGTTRVSARLSAHLGIAPLEGQLGHYNVALDEVELAHKLALNQSHTHDLGNDQYSTANAHRVLDYFVHELGVAPPREAFVDVRTKRHLISQARELAQQHAAPAISYAVDPEVEAGLDRMFRESNARFQTQIGRDLGYPC